MNKSGINPVEYNILVQPDAVAEKTSGGLYKPGDVTDREKFAEMKATVVAVGGLAFTRTSSGDDWVGKKPKPGARVLLAKYAGVSVKGDDDKDYRVVKDEDVVALLTGGGVCNV